MSTKFMFDYIDQMYFSYYYLHVNKIIYNNSVQNMKIQMLIAYIYFVEFDLKHYSIRKILLILSIESQININCKSKIIITKQNFIK